MMVVFFGGFTLSGRVLFGHIVKRYSTILDTGATLIRIFAGDFQYKDVCEADWLLGPIFLGGYIFIMYFILANVAIAIINEAFQKTMFKHRTEELTTKSFLKRAYYNLFCRCLRTVKKPQQSEDTTYNEIYSLLKRSNFNDEEIIMFLSKYEIFPDVPLCSKYMKTVKKKLELISFQQKIPATQTTVIQSIKYEKNSGEFHVLTKEEYEDLQAQLNHIELLIDLAIEQITKLHEELAHVLTEGSNDYSAHASMTSSLAF
ncbi:polycystic kidney disease 2-like 1 protein [Chrysoperla carnea]|uniref:polycystic kidney disease 2-like 1 protein n=1 Tax=Chrysoperla carnea TaxID=189513 RepID=UPI001D08F187|nr:polycystic kidney disease 2-like 1 protein [Chrysoperla carnea]